MREVWIATTEGVFLFDGLTVNRKQIRWQSNSDVPLKRALEFVKAQNGETYLFTTQDGIFKLPNRGTQFDRIPETDLVEGIDRLTSLAHSRTQDAVVFTTADRVFSLSLNDSKVSEIILDVANKYGPAQGLMAAKGGPIHVVFNEYVVSLVWQVDRFVTKRVHECTLDIPSISTVARSAGNIFHVTDHFGDMHKLEISGIQCRRLPMSKGVAKLIAKSRVNAVQQLASNGALGVSTDKGLILAGPKTLSVLTTENSAMRSNEITAVEEASNGSLIVGTFRGVIHAVKSQFISVTRLPLDRRPTVTAVASSKETGTFIASSKGVYREVIYDDGISFQPLNLQQGHSNVSALEVTSAGIWIGFQNGSLLYCRLAEGKTSCSNSVNANLSKSPITSISKRDGQNPDVIVTTIDGVAFTAKVAEQKLSVEVLFDKTDKKSKLLAVEVADRNVWFFDLEGSMYVPTAMVGVKNCDSIVQIEPNQFVDDSWAMASANGFVYLATPGGGVFAYREEDIAANRNHVPVWSSFVDEAIFAIELDSLGRAWIATSSGLWLRHNDGVFRLAIKATEGGSIAIDYGASHTDSEGNLYFGGTGGLITVRSPTSYPVTPSGSVEITAIAVDERYVEFKREYEDDTESRLLRVEDANSLILIEYGLHSLLPQITAPFQHKLEGFDTDWQDSGNINRVSYQNLPPGRYNFRARGADSTGVWSDNEINLPIEVLPPLWRSWWALLTYFILTAALITYLKRLNDRYIAHRERLKLAEEGSAAFARLEDDYQAQREANEVLLLRRGPSATRLLDVVETALSAQDTKVSSGPEALALVNKLHTLRGLQVVTTRTTSEERTDLHALTDEIAARLAESNPQASHAIITNAVCKDPVPLEHATYLSLVIQESLELATSGRKFEDAVDPMIYISLASPTVKETGDYLYELCVEDSGLKEIGSDTLDRLLPLTFHLIETGGGELTEHFDAGNTLSINLIFAPQASDVS